MSDYSKYIWYNNEMVNWEDANTHVMSHVLHYGSGVFEGLKCYDTKNGPSIFRLKDHISRLYKSASIYDINIPFEEKVIREACIDVIKKNNLKDCYVRPIAFYGYDTLGVKPKNCPVNVAVASFFWGAYLGKAGLNNGVNICISPWQKFSYKALPSTAKACGQYMNSMLSVNHAKSNGFDEGLLLDYRGFVAEGSGQNIFIVKSGKIYTNDEKSSILLGITRETIIEFCSKIDIEVIIKDLTKEELFNADEVFFTGTASEVTPVVSIDKIEINNSKVGEITKLLQSMYMNVVLAKDDSYKNWLTIVK